MPENKRRFYWQRMDQTTSIDYNLYIPRATLSSSNSSSKTSSQFKDFAVERGATNGEISEISGESESEGIYGSSIQNDDAVRANRNRMYSVYKAKKPVSESHSNKNSFTSSKASNHSNYSVNSLLLSVKNLENFNKSSKQMQLSRKPSRIYSEVNPNVIMKSNFYDGYLIANESNNRYPIKEYRSNMLQNIKSISANNLHSVVPKQEKEADAISMTSSNTTTNFTVVSLNDSHKRLNKSKAICRRSRQISILIIIMTLLFIILIAFMLVLLDMRNQKMPR